MKDETVGVAIVDVNSEHKKTKGVNKNVVATISHKEPKDAFLNNKCLIYSMNRIQSIDHRIGTYEINKNFCLTLITKYKSKTMDVVD